MSRLCPSGVPPDVPPSDADGIGIQGQFGTTGQCIEGRTHVCARAREKWTSSFVPMSHFMNRLGKSNG